jgi:hypothetical protein
MPSAPTAQFSSAPPLNRSNKPHKTAPAHGPDMRHEFAQGDGIHPGRRNGRDQAAHKNMPKVKRMRCRSSGMRRLLEKAESMGRLPRGLAYHLAAAARRFDLGLGRGAEGMRLDRQLAAHVAIAQNLDPLRRPR